VDSVSDSDDARFIVCRDMLFQLREVVQGELGKSCVELRREGSGEIGGDERRQGGGERELGKLREGQGCGQ